MPNTKISALTAASALAGTEVLPVVQSSATVGATVDQIRDVVKAVDATSTDGLILETSTAATVGAQKYSPRVRWKGFGWKTDATAASQAVEFTAEVVPVQGTSAPTGSLYFYSSINGGAFSERLRIDSSGVVAAQAAIRMEVAGTVRSALSSSSVLGGQKVLIGRDPVGGLPFVALPSDGKIGFTASTSALTLDSNPTLDAAFARNAAGVIEANSGTAGAYRDTIVRSSYVAPSSANGQSLGIMSLTELTTIAAAATTDTTIQMPAGAIVFAVSCRVTTAITCTTNFNIGDSGSATRFGTNISKAVNTTNAGTVAPYVNASALSVRITPDTVPSDATGRLRVTIYYMLSTPPTS